jgi:hypothetical protein
MKKSILRLDTQIPLYLLSEKNKPSCERIGRILWVSGDTIIRHMSEKLFTWQDLYQEVSTQITNKTWWILAVDDSVQDRLRSYESKSDLISQHYSGNHKSIVNGVDIVTLFRVCGEQKLPINFRILDPKWDKTKHHLLREMLDEVLERWFKPLLVTADSFYSTNDTITKLIQKRIGLFMGIKSNRLARELSSFEQKASYEAITCYSIPWEWKVMHLKWLGLLKVFRFDDRNYIYHSWSDETKIDYKITQHLTRNEAEKIQRSHRCIEEYHRVLKQLCNLEWMIFRHATQISNHIFYSIKAYCILEVTRTKRKLSSRYHTITNDTLQYSKDLFSKMSLDGLCLVY